MTIEYYKLTWGEVREFLGDIKTPFRAKSKSDGRILTAQYFLRNPFNRHDVLVWTEEAGDISVFELAENYEICADETGIVRLITE